MTAGDLERVDAAARLGARMDGLLATISRLPAWAWGTGLVILLWATFPHGHTRRREMVGLVLDDRLSIWASRFVVLAVMGLVVALAFFAVRSVLRFLEQDRWPHKAGGVEMEALGAAREQLAADADRLSGAADEERKIVAVLEESRRAILLLHGESLERYRQRQRHEGHGRASGQSRIGRAPSMRSWPTRSGVSTLRSTTQSATNAV